MSHDHDPCPTCDARIEELHQQLAAARGELADLAVGTVHAAVRRDRTPRLVDERTGSPLDDTDDGDGGR